MVVNQAKRVVQDTFKQIQHQVHEGVAGVLDAGAFISSTTDPLEKLAKVSHRSIDFIQTFFKFSVKGLVALSSRLKDTVEVFEAVHIVERYKEMFFPDANGKYFYEVNNWKKCADRTLLTVFSTMKTTWFFYTMGLVSLGAAGTVSIGSLAVFKLVTEGFNVGSSIFGAWDSTDKVFEMRSKSKQVKNKIEKWGNYADYLAKVKAGDADTIAKLETKYVTKTFLLKYEGEAIQTKLDKVKLYSNILDGNDLVVSEELNKKLVKKSPEELKEKFKVKAQMLADKVATLQAARNVFEVRLADIQAENYSGLSEKLAQIDANFKLKKWEVIKKNCTTQSTKSWLNILNKIFKIASISLAMTLIAINYWAAPVLLTLLGLGIISDSFNLTKHIYDHYVKMQPVPKAPAPMPVVPTVTIPSAKSEAAKSISSDLETQVDWLMKDLPIASVTA